MTEDEEFTSSGQSWAGPEAVGDRQGASSVMASMGCKESGH